MVLLALTSLLSLVTAIARLRRGDHGFLMVAPLLTAAFGLAGLWLEMRSRR